MIGNNTEMKWDSNRKKIISAMPSWCCGRYKKRKCRCTHSLHFNASLTRVCVFLPCVKTISHSFRSIFFLSSFGFCHSGYLSFLFHADTRTRIETTHNDTFDALFLSIKWQCFVDCFFSFLCFYAVSSRHCRPPAFFKNEYCFFFHSVFIVVSNKF